MAAVIMADDNRVRYVFAAVNTRGQLSARTIRSSVAGREVDREAGGPINRAAPRVRIRTRSQVAATGQCTLAAPGEAITSGASIHNGIDFSEYEEPTK
jgi:hypothetical protein